MQRQAMSLHLYFTELCPFVILSMEILSAIYFKTVQDIFRKLSKRAVDVHKIRITTPSNLLMRGGEVGLTVG